MQKTSRSGDAIRLKQRRSLPEPDSARPDVLQASASRRSEDVLRLTLANDATYPALHPQDLLRLRGVSRALRAETNTTACWRRMLATSLRGTAAQLPDAAEFRSVAHLRALTRFVSTRGGRLDGSGTPALGHGSSFPQRCSAILTTFRTEVPAERTAKLDALVCSRNEARKTLLKITAFNAGTTGIQAAFFYASVRVDAVFAFAIVVWVLVQALGLLTFHDSLTKWFACSQRLADLRRAHAEGWA